MSKIFLLFSFLILALTLTACTGPESDISSPPSGKPNIEETADILPRDYVGLSVEDAQALADQNGVPFRVVMRDGEPLPVTMDWRPGRINAAVENGLVVSYEIEGQENTQGTPPPPPLPSLSYNAESWKEVIPETCQVFSDGCNTCRRSENSEAIACTRKFCQEYKNPRCLDETET